MKKIFSILTVLVLLTALAASLAACGKKEEKANPNDPAALLGRWDAMDWITKAYGVSRETILEANPDAAVIMEFTDENIVTRSFIAHDESDTEKESFPYSTDGNVINIGGVRSYWKIENDVLYIWDNDISVAYPRVK